MRMIKMATPDHLVIAIIIMLMIVRFKPKSVVRVHHAVARLAAAVAVHAAAAAVALHVGVVHAHLRHVAPAAALQHAAAVRILRQRLQRHLPLHAHAQVRGGRRGGARPVLLLLLHRQHLLLLHRHRHLRLRLLVHGRRLPPHALLVRHLRLHLRRHLRLVHRHLARLLPVLRWHCHRLHRRGGHLLHLAVLLQLLHRRHLHLALLHVARMHCDAALLLLLVLLVLRVLRLPLRRLLVVLLVAQLRLRRLVVKLGKVLVLQRVERRDALAGLVHQHALQQVQAQRVQHGQRAGQRLRAPLGEVVLEVRELAHVGPRGLVGGAQHAEDVEDLVDLAVAGEERAAADHLRKDAADGPDVNGRGVVLGAQEDLGRAVPQRDHQLRHRRRRDAAFVALVLRVLPGQPKVAHLELPPVVVQDVGGLQISVQDPVLMQVRHAREQLEHELLRLRHRKRLLHLVVHAVLEVVLHVLHHHVHLIAALANDHLRDVDDVGVVELHKNVNLADGGLGEALLEGLLHHLDALQRAYLLGFDVPRLVHHTIRALRDLADALVEEHAAALLQHVHRPPDGRDVRLPDVAVTAAAVLLVQVLQLLVVERLHRGLLVLRHRGRRARLLHLLVVHVHPPRRLARRRPRGRPRRALLAVAVAAALRGLAL
mmetsp:Transcript_12080/g.30515  ORF Transcript_12080/g.30515 Transcript_12080/m.30515 type:complete len:653 (-) Transcript_12080:267-2225(-)